MKRSDGLSRISARQPAVVPNRLDMSGVAIDDSAPLIGGHARMADGLKNWASGIKRDVHALYLATRDPRVPWYAKCLAMFVAGYALSPIDLIPDFIPVLGYLDDLIIVPLGIVLVIRLTPPEVMVDHRAAAAVAQQLPVSRNAAAAIVSHLDRVHRGNGVARLSLLRTG